MVRNHVDVVRNHVDVVRNHVDVVPDSNRLVPDSNRLVPDSNRLVPDSNRLVPDSNRLVPDSTHRVQDPCVPLRNRVWLDPVSDRVRATQLDVGRPFLRLHDLELDPPVRVVRRGCMSRILGAILAVPLAA